MKINKELFNSAYNYTYLGSKTIIRIFNIQNT